jgi:hypothetical protein
MTTIPGSTSTTPQRVSSVLEYRDAMVASLKRRLFGPTPEFPDWYSQEQSILINDKADFPDRERAIGPFHNASREEVLPISPRSLYYSGVLWGTHEITDDFGNDEFAGDPDDLEPGLTDLPEVDDIDKDDVPDDVDQLGRRRSISISFRTPTTTAMAKVGISFGTYSPITASFSGRHETLWERTPHQITTTISLDSSGQETIQSAAHRLSIGWKVRDSDSSKLVTVSFTNMTGPQDVDEPEKGALFQFTSEIQLDELLRYATQLSLRDSVDLLYRDIEDLAIGHGTDVSVEEVDSGYVISSQAIPVVNVPVMTPDIKTPDGHPYGIYMDDLAEFNDESVAGIKKLINDYGSWIVQQEAATTEFSGDTRELAQKNLAMCKVFLQEIQEGFDLVQSDPEIRQCLMDASSAMNQQRIGATASVRNIELVNGEIIVDEPFPHDNPQRHHSMWRPFQIAFILASIPKVVDSESVSRANVDVIWMPTGGGKTEAYLGLAAFTILWERFKVCRGEGTKSGSSTKVIMRYTLRLLTVQQFLRSASLICALELIREKQPDRYGSGEVRIGTWVGSKTTPNKRSHAVEKHGRAARNQEPLPFLLTRCPWCGCQMGVSHDNSIIGYAVVQVVGSKEKRVLPYCPDRRCPFTKRTVQRGQRTFDRGLPILEVDEDVYQFPPDFVLGTVDKVAMMWRQPEAQRLLGLENGVRKSPPPALFIQDELHLITGPLGSLDGMYEVMLEELCTTDRGRAPLYVASTATTRSYERQIRSLYGRSSKLVPPPGITIDDSFFSRVDPSQPARRYVGVCSSGGSRNSSLQLAVLTTLAHFAPVLQDFMDPDTGVSPDPYWTNVCFFSSRATLGTLASTVESFLNSDFDLIRRSSGSKSGSVRDEGGRSRQRFLRQPREITATASENVTDVLDDLGNPLGAKDVVDLCFATSMIEVGLDVPRLGLMTVMGQPKGSSQYIQVTGRVGRNHKAPALVIDVLSARNPRDRSHYEHFIASHRKMYASVEGASVTPFTEQALERTLPSVAAILCQILGGSGTVPEQVNRYWDRLNVILLERADMVDPVRGRANLLAALNKLRKSVAFPKVSTFSWVDEKHPESQFLFAFGQDLPKLRISDFWRVLTSMRSVDPDAPAIIHTPSILQARVSTQTKVSTDLEIEI